MRRRGRDASEDLLDLLAAAEVEEDGRALYGAAAFEVVPGGPR